MSTSVVLEVFNQQKHDHAVEFIAGICWPLDAARAIPYLEACLQKRKYCPTHPRHSAAADRGSATG